MTSETDRLTSYRYKTHTNRIGLWLFLLSDSFVFGGLAVMRFNLLGMTRPHLNQYLGLLVTAVAHLLLLHEPRGDGNAAQRS